MMADRSKATSKKQTQKSKKSKRQQPPPDVPKPKDVAEIIECVWLQEAVRSKLRDIAEQTDMNSQMVDTLHNKGVLTPEERAKVTEQTAASEFLWLLVQKEQPSIWPDVLEVLLMQEGQAHVIDMINNEAKRLKENPAVLLKLNETSHPSLELQNSARLASLLLDHGTGLLAGFLCDKLEARFGSLESTFESPDFQQALEDHYTGRNGAVQLLFGNQYSLVQHCTDSPIERIWNLNFSLILNLLDIVLLQGHSKLSNVPKQDVPALYENIHTLKHLRTMIFLHIQDKGTNTAQFAVMLDALTNALLHFASISSKKRKLSEFVKKGEAKTFSSTKVFDLRKAMMLCQENDGLQTNDLIQKYNQELSTTLQAQGRQLEQTNVAMNNLAEVMHSICVGGVKVRAQLDTTADGIPGMSLRFGRMEGAIKLAAAQLTRQLDRVEASANAHAVTSASQLNRVETTVKSGTKQILTKLETLPTAEQNSNVHLSEVREVFKRHRDSFKILVMNRARDLNENREELSKMLGQCDWDFIVDFDYESRATGIHDAMSTILRQHKHFRVLAYNEEMNLSELIRKSVANGEQAIWFLANGCSETGCKKGELSFGKVLKPFDSILESVLEEIEYPKPVLVVTLLAGSSCLDHIQDMLSRLFSVCQVVDEHINYEATNLVAVSISPQAQLVGADLKIKPLAISTPLSQALTVFEALYSSPSDEDFFYFPGDQGPCTISKPRLNSLQTMMVVYHRDIGKIEFGDLNARARNLKITDMRVQYLRGGDISPEAFYLHERFGKAFYALRSDMKTAKQLIKTELELRQSDPSKRYSRDVIKLLHDPSGGGSTVLEYVLYSLKDDFPCVKLRHIDQSVPGSIRDLFRNSKLPLLIAIDNPEISANAAASLMYSLFNENIQCVIVHTAVTAHKAKANTTPAVEGNTVKNDDSDTPLQIYVSSTLTDKDDIMTFTDIYEEFRNVDTDKVYLFGLNAFCEDYKRLNEVVVRCMKRSTCGQLKVLRIVCCLDKYANFSVKLRLLAPLIQEKAKAKSVTKETDVLKQLGPIGELLIYNSDNHTLRIIHQCILSPVYEHFETSMSKRELITTNVLDLIELIRDDSSDKKNSETLCRNLILLRTDQMTERYSSFIIELVEVHEFDKSTVGSHLKNIIDVLEGSTLQSHIRALYARFLLLELKNMKESIIQIKLALGIRLPHISIQLTNDHQDNHHLLTAYGNIYRHVAVMRFNKGKETETTVDDILMLTLNDVKESVCAFRLAQSKIFISDSTHNRISPFPFLGESIVRTTFLHKIFDHKCNKNHDTFRQYIISSTDPFIQDCETDALDVLDKVMQYKQLDKLQDQNPRQTFKRIIELKFKLLRLRHDSRHTSQKLLYTLPTDTPCDIAMLVRAGKVNNLHVDASTINLAPWEDLSEEELEMIIVRIDERIGESKLLSCNYNDVIMAMINLRQLNQTQKKFRKYNMDYAIFCAETWKEYYPDHLQAHFMYSVLSFTKGVKAGEIQSLRNFNTGFQKCQEILQKTSSMRGRRRRKFEVGIGTGLSAVVPYSRITGKGKLQKFEGRLVSRNEILVNPFGSELKAFPALRDEVSSLPVEQKPIVTFNLIICYDAILAQHIEMHTPT